MRRDRRAGRGPSGEAVKAFIVRGDPALDAAAIRDFCEHELTNYKVPKLVEFRDDLPKSNVGKILPSAEAAALPRRRWRRRSQ